jgi:hypothetical protein
MESPNATMVAAAAGACTSTPETQYQACEVVASVSSAAVVKSPALEM